MQSDAFPTPLIYSLQLQPRLMPDYVDELDGNSHENVEANSEHLIHKIEMLMAECSSEETQSFWVATDRIKIKHRIIESMQKIESLFLDLAKDSTQNPELIAAVSESLLYTNECSQHYLDIPNFLKPRLS
ncbi:MAG: hypothetical protein DCE90_11980 [Pseudanabaena sp.]|nr:MAG: hypothetical protein DCE90_11980 [Pseudanabaena sp.]